MNVIAAAPGWRDLAVWTMPPAAYALASDTLIGVVRAWVIARHSEPAAGLAAEEATLLAMAGGLLLWLLRLSMAPASTLAGFRTWVLEECPVAPGRRAARPAPAAEPVPAPEAAAVAPRGSGPRGETKTARFLALVTERHGPLAAIPLEAVAKISAALAPAGRPERRVGAGRAAPRRAGRPERRPAMIIKYAIALAVLLLLAAVVPVGVPARPVPARQPGPAPAASGCTCGCTPARASPPSSACGCAGAGWPRCAARGGSAGRCRCGTGCWRRGSTRCSWAGRTGGTGCGSRWKSTCW